MLNHRGGHCGHLRQVLAGRRGHTKTIWSVKEARVELTPLKDDAIHHLLVERQGGVNAADTILREGAAHAQNRLGPGFAPNNQLGQQWIIGTDFFKIFNHLLVQIG